MQPDVLDEGLLALEHAVAVGALQVRRLVLQVVLTQLPRVAEALLTNLAEMPGRAKLITIIFYTYLDIHAADWLKSTLTLHILAHATISSQKGLAGICMSLP